MSFLPKTSWHDNGNLWRGGYWSHTWNPAQAEGRPMDTQRGNESFLYPSRLPFQLQCQDLFVTFQRGGGGTGGNESFIFFMNSDLGWN